MCGYICKTIFSERDKNINTHTHTQEFFICECLFFSNLVYFSYIYIYISFMFLPMQCYHVNQKDGSQYPTNEIIAELNLHIQQYFLLQLNLITFSCLALSSQVQLHTWFQIPKHQNPNIKIYLKKKKKAKQKNNIYFRIYIYIYIYTMIL